MAELLGRGPYHLCPRPRPSTPGAPPTRRNSAKLGPPPPEVGTHRFHAPIRTQVPSKCENSSDSTRDSAPTHRTARSCGCPNCCAQPLTLAERDRARPSVRDLDIPCGVPE